MEYEVRFVIADKVFEVDAENEDEAYEEGLRLLNETKREDFEAYDVEIEEMGE